MSASHRNSGAGQLLRYILVETDDSGAQQFVKVTGLMGQTIGKAVRDLPFGFSSHVPPGGEGLVAAMGGGHDRAHVHGPQHPKWRPRKLPVGATRIHDASTTNHVHIDSGTLRVQHASRVLLKVGDDVTITMNGNSITAAVGGISLRIDAGGFHFTGGAITHDGHRVDKTHKHVNSGGSGLSGVPE